MKLEGNRPPGDNPLLFAISGTGSFICPVVILGSKDDKLRFMTRLYRSENAEEKFNRISIANDLTREDREKVKQKV